MVLYHWPCTIIISFAYFVCFLVPMCNIHCPCILLGINVLCKRQNPQYSINIIELIPLISDIDVYMFRAVWLLHNLTLDGKLCLRDDKNAALFNSITSCHSRRAWKTSRCACALAGSRFWLVESTLFRDHVTLRLHRAISLKFNLFN